ncbi:MAG: hypothetical protein J6U73_06905 [Alistipes sp.]|nr:hypothetical protein [Alistipes sp.]
MIFKTMPQNGASWQKPLLYNLEFERREEQVTVEIYDLLYSEKLGSIMLYNLTSAEIDIAPYIRSRKLSEPLAKQESVIALSHDACRVVLRVNGVESEPRLLFRSDISGLSPQVMSATAESGTIAVGETIRLTVLAHSNITLTLLQPSDGGFSKYEYATDGVPCELAVPVNNAKLGDVIALRVVCDNKVVMICNYRVVERDSSAVRLMWVNAKGGTESHTFPLSVKRSLVVKSEDIEGECGWYRRVTGSTLVRRVMLLGATPSEVDAVLDILLSPKVVRCDNGGEMAVQLLTDTVAYDDHGRVRRLEFDIKEEWKGGML